MAEPESDKVLYIDYGNTEPVETLLAVRPLDEEFYSLPASCVGVSTSAEVTAEGVDPLLIVVQECVFKGTFKSIGANEWFVDLQTEDGKRFEDFVEETNSGSKRAKEAEKVYDAFENWQLFEERKVKVTAVYSPSRFYLQLEEDAEKLARTGEELELALKTVLPLVGGTNDLCAAKSFDNKWYRCYQTDNIAIDYGFVLNATLYKRLPVSFTVDRSKYVIECGLNVESPEPEWNEVTITHFKELVKPESKIVAKLETRRKNKVVDLTVSGTSITELLVNEGIAKYRNYQVVLSHVVSLDEFYAQEKETEDELFDMLDQLKEAENWEAVTPEVGQIVVAKFIEDEQWYRASVTSTTDGVSVRFIDYGNESVCEEFRALPEHLKDVPKFASLCSSHPLPQNADELKEKFAAFVIENAESPFFAYFLSRVEPMLVMLYFDGKLIEEYLQEKPPPTVAFENVSVSHLNSPSSFYVQPETPLLDEVAVELENVESTEPVTDVQVDEMYAAKFPDDGLWYRAKAISSNEMLFVDYGNTSATDDVRYLPASLKKIPFLAKHCAIPPPSSSPEWPEVATQRFAELTCDGNTIFKMDIIEEGDPSFVLLDDNGVNVMDELNTLCQAEKTATSKENDKPEVMLSHINGLSEIWVQEQTPSLDELADELTNVDALDVLETAEQGAIVAALFDEDDVWYRAKILEKLDDGFHVLFIDYGNESGVTQIRALPEDLTLLPAFAVSCCLFGLPENADQWPAAVLDKLKEISDSAGTFVLGQKIEENGVQYVSLQYEDGKDLTDELIKIYETLSGQADTCVGEEKVDVDQADDNVSEEKVDVGQADGNVSEEKVNIGRADDDVGEEKTDVTEAHSGVVTEANSISEFYVQNDTEAVKAVQSSLQDGEHVENAEPVVNDVFSALKEEDNAWYRSRIESIDESKGEC